MKVWTLKTPNNGYIRNINNYWNTIENDKNKIYTLDVDEVKHYKSKAGCKNSLTTHIKSLITSIKSSKDHIEYVEKNNLKRDISWSNKKYYNLN